MVMRVRTSRSMHAGERAHKHKHTGVPKTIPLLTKSRVLYMHSTDTEMGNECRTMHIKVKIKIMLYCTKNSKIQTFFISSSYIKWFCNM